MLRKIVVLYLAAITYSAYMIYSCSPIDDMPDASIEITLDASTVQDSSNGNNNCSMTWAPISTLSESVLQQTICKDGFVIEDHVEKQEIVKNVLPQLCCVEQIGAWFKNQSCVQDAILTQMANSTNPPQQFLYITVKIKGKTELGDGYLTFLDFQFSSYCNPVCKDINEQNCKDRFMMWGFGTSK